MKSKTIYYKFIDIMFGFVTVLTGIVACLTIFLIPVGVGMMVWGIAKMFKIPIGSGNNLKCLKK